MILDAWNLFSNAQSFAGVAAATTASTNTLDFGITSGIPTSANGGGARDMGATGDRPRIFARVTTAFAGGTNLICILKGAVDDLTGAPAAFSTYWTSPTYTTAQLVLGAKLFEMDVPRPPQGVAMPRYYRMDYTTVGTFTAGVIWSGFVLDRPDQAWQGTDNSILGGYPAGITVAN